MNTSVDKQDPIPVDSLKGKRYTFEEMRPALVSYLDVSGPTVPAAVGKEILKLLNGKQTNILPLKDGRPAKLQVINNADRGLSIHAMHVQARLQLRDSYMGHTFTDRDKENLQRTGDMGRVVELNSGDGKPFRGLIGINGDTHRLTIINVDGFPIPDKILNVPITPADKEILRQGLPIRLNNLQRDSETFSAFVRLAASRKGFKFERIKIPKLAQSPQPRQAMHPANRSSGRATNDASLLDSLVFASKGIPAATQTYPNGVQAMVIRQNQPDKFVVSITIPSEKVASDERKLFALPIMAFRADADALLKLSGELDRAVGRHQSLQSVIQAAPDQIQKLVSYASPLSIAKERLPEPTQSVGVTRAIEPNVGIDQSAKPTTNPSKEISQKVKKTGVIKSGSPIIKPPKPERGRQP